MCKVGVVIFILVILLIWWGVSSAKKLTAETPADRRQNILDAAQTYYSDNCFQAINADASDVGAIPNQENNKDYIKSVSIKDADKVNNYINNGGTIPDSDDIFECVTDLCTIDPESLGADSKTGCPMDMYCSPTDISSKNKLTYSLLNQSDKSIGSINTP